MQCSNSLKITPNPLRNADSPQKCGILMVRNKNQEITPAPATALTIFSNIYSLITYFLRFYSIP
jgi:hypothetical protein